MNFPCQYELESAVAENLPLLLISVQAKVSAPPKPTTSFFPADVIRSTVFQE